MADGTNISSGPNNTGNIDPAFEAYFSGQKSPAQSVSTIDPSFEKYFNQKPLSVDELGSNIENSINNWKANQTRENQQKVTDAFADYYRNTSALQRAGYTVTPALKSIANLFKPATEEQIHQAYTQDNTGALSGLTPEAQGKGMFRGGVNTGLDVGTMGAKAALGLSAQMEALTGDPNEAARLATASALGSQIGESEQQNYARYGQFTGQPKEGDIGAAGEKVAQVTRTVLPFLVPGVGEAAEAGEAAQAANEAKAVSGAMEAQKPSLIARAAEKIPFVGKAQGKPALPFTSLEDIAVQGREAQKVFDASEANIKDIGKELEGLTPNDPEYASLKKSFDSEISKRNDAKSVLDQVAQAQPRAEKALQTLRNQQLGATLGQTAKNTALGALTGGAYGALTSTPGTNILPDIAGGALYGGTRGIVNKVTEPARSFVKEQLNNVPEGVEPATPVETLAPAPAQESAPAPAPEQAPAQPEQPAPVAPAQPAPTAGKPLATVPTPQGATSAFTGTEYKPRMVYTVAPDVTDLTPEQKANFDVVIKSSDSPVANAIPIKNNGLKSAGYGSGTLYIEFSKPTSTATGEISQYMYADVPKDLYTKMMNSDNPYSFFQKNIRNKYNQAGYHNIHTPEELANRSSGQPLQPLAQQAPVASTQPLAAKPEPAPAPEAPQPFMGSVPAMPPTEARLAPRKGITPEEAQLGEPPRTREQVVADQKAQQQAEADAQAKAQSEIDKARAKEEADIQEKRQTPEYQQMTQWLKAADKLAQRQVASGSALTGIERNPTATQISNVTRSGGATALNKIPADQLDKAFAEIQSPKTEKPTYGEFTGKQPIQGLPVKEVPTAGEKLTPEQEGIKQAFLDHFAEIEQNRANNAKAAQLKEYLAKQAAESNKPLATAPVPKGGRKKVSLAASQPHEGPEEKPLGTSSP